MRLAPEGLYHADAADRFLDPGVEGTDAAELRLPIPVVIWNDEGYGMIRHGMDAAGMARTADSPLTPDFARLAEGLACRFARPKSAAGFQAAVTAALSADAPTLIVVDEGAGWLGGDR